MSHFELIEATGSTPESLARVNDPEREPFRIGAVQQAWHEDPVTHQDLLAEGIRLAAGAGARIVCLQELTLSPYFAITEDAIGEAEGWAEEIGDGATSEFARRIASNPLDHQARIDLAMVENGNGNRQAAVDQLIEVMRRERGWNDDAARKQLLLFFDVWGPKDEATISGRRKLSSLLFS